jgi:hypothetical protein
LLLLERRGLAGGDLAALQAVLDALLLVDVALHRGRGVGLGEGAGGGEGQQRGDDEVAVHAWGSCRVCFDSTESRDSEATTRPRQPPLTPAA